MTVPAAKQAPQAPVKATQTPATAPTAPVVTPKIETPKVDPLAFLSAVTVEPTDVVRESQSGAILDAHPQIREWIKTANDSGKPAKVKIPAGFEKRVENLMRMAATELKRGLSVSYRDGHLHFATKDPKESTPAVRAVCASCGRSIAKTQKGVLRDHKTPAGDACVNAGIRPDAVPASV